MATDTGIDVGDLVRLARLFTDETGEPTDPESVALVVETPSDQGLAPEVHQATEDELAACAAVLGQTLDDTTGVWTVVIEATEHGLWRYEWRASGGVQSVEPGSFLVRRSRVGSSLASSPGSSGIVAGGVLSGTYPNPGFAVDMATQAELDAVDDRVTTLEGAGVGGGAQVLDLGVIELTDLLAGPALLVDHSDAIVFGVMLGDVVTGGAGFERIYFYPSYLTLADIAGGSVNYWAFGDLLNVDVEGPGGTIPFAVASGLRAWLADGLFNYPVAGPWVTGTEYPTHVTLVESGHYWENQGSAGTSGGVEPDFAGNIGGTVVDNDITWTDVGAVPAAGSVHAYALAGVPVIP